MQFETKSHESLKAALPIMAGYVAIGVPCGILESKIGLSPWMSLVLSLTFYSGAGQFMICNMWMAGSPIASIIASVAFVNTRQILYSTAFSPYFSKVRKRLTLLFSATVTDESFGVNLMHLAAHDGWDAVNATLVNLFSLSSWALSNFAGCLVGSALALPVAITSFAMTAIFICLLVTQKLTWVSGLVAASSASVVCLCKVVGLAGPAIFIGAVAGVACGIVAKGVSGR